MTYPIDYIQKEIAAIKVRLAIQQRRLEHWEGLEREALEHERESSENPDG